ncbi:MAG: hypothetical protein AAF645_16715 [Myxococcota bacterium]
MARALIVLALLSGCQLVVDFDRSRIDDAGMDGTDTDGDAAEEASADAADEMATDAAMETSADAGVEASTDAEIEASTDAADGAEAGGDAAECTMPSECDDLVACTMNACTDTMCVFTPDDAACDDTNLCTRDVCGASDCEYTDCAFTASAEALLASALRLTSADGGEGGLLAAVFENDAGAAGTFLGAAALAAGEQTDVDVLLSRDLVDDEMLFVQLFEDLGTVGTYDEGVDTAALDAMGMPVSEVITVNVPAGLPDFRVNVSGDGVDYTFAMAGPDPFNADGQDPTLVLIRGARYRIENSTAGAHPFEFITIDTPDDVIALAQGGAAGTVEAEATIDWIEDGSAVIFTVSAEFEAAIDGYRCTVHPDTMRGLVTFEDAI